MNPLLAQATAAHAASSTAPTTHGVAAAGAAGEAKVETGTIAIDISVPPPREAGGPPLDLSDSSWGQRLLESALAWGTADRLDEQMRVALSGHTHKIDKLLRTNEPNPFVRKVFDAHDALARVEQQRATALQADWPSLDAQVAAARVCLADAQALARRTRPSVNKLIGRIRFELQAVHQNPDSNRHYRMLAFYLTRCGRFSDAVQAEERGQALDDEPPSFRYYQNVSALLLQSGRAEDAVALLEIALPALLAQPRDELPSYYLANEIVTLRARAKARNASGDFLGALRDADRAAAVGMSTHSVRLGFDLNESLASIRAVALHGLGRNDEVDAQLESLERDLTLKACTLIEIGRIEQAIECMGQLDRSAAAAVIWSPALLNSPSRDRIRESAEFGRLVLLGEERQAMHPDIVNIRIDFRLPELDSPPVHPFITVASVSQHRASVR